MFIFNQGTGPGTFDITLVDRVMMPDGQILGVDEAQARALIMKAREHWFTA